MNTKALKAKILDLAIHGKLVPQNPEHESAEKLLEKIRAEKEEKIAKGELKRDKKDSYIFVGDDKRHYEKFADGTVKDIEDEIPFDVPEGWAWCRISEVCKPFGRIGFRGYTKADIVDKGYGAISLSPSNMKEMKVTFENCTYISWEKYEESPEIMINENDIIIVKTGSSYGKTCIIRNLPEKVTLNPQLMVLKNVIINSSYLCYYLNTKYFRKCYENLVNGTAIPTFSQEKFANNFIPLPPIEEQKQIVAKIEEIFTQIDSIETGKADLQTAIKHAKSKILDLAIHGKLVPQNPSEEPASKLLERIRAEKEAKIAAGELKRDKNDSYIYKNPSDNCHYRKYANGQEENVEAEIPFDLPKDWTWCQLGTIAYEMADGPFGSDLKKEHYTDKKEARIIQLGNIGEGFWREENTKYTTFEHAKEISRSIVKPGTLVIAKMMPAGRTIICPNKEAMYVLSSDSIRCSHSELVNKEYLLKVINSDLFRKKIADDTQGTTRARTNIAKLKAGIFPLPPAEEQKRIVSKIEEIFGILDTISKNLE